VRGKGSGRYWLGLSFAVTEVPYSNPHPDLRYIYSQGVINQC